LGVFWSAEDIGEGPEHFLDFWLLALVVVVLVLVLVVVLGVVGFAGRPRAARSAASAAVWKRCSAVDANLRRLAAP
jgi:hypothetical protein